MGARGTDRGRFVAREALQVADRQRNADPPVRVARQRRERVAGATA
jgi:hypothetical protein